MKCRVEGAGLCPDCLRRAAEYEAKPKIVSSGGFCLPKQVVWMGYPSCEIYHAPNFGQWLSYRSKRHLLRHPRGAWADWKESQEGDGELIHGFVGPLELPEIRATRGGFKFSDPNPA